VEPPRSAKAWDHVPAPVAAGILKKKMLPSW